MSNMRWCSLQAPPPNNAVYWEGQRCLISSPPILRKPTLVLVAEVPPLGIEPRSFLFPELAPPMYKSFVHIDRREPPPFPGSQRVRREERHGD